MEEEGRITIGKEEWEEVKRELRELKEKWVECKEWMKELNGKEKGWETRIVRLEVGSLDLGKEIEELREKIEEIEKERRREFERERNSEGSEREGVKEKQGVTLIGD